MRLFGNSFLRSNFKGGDPVRITAGALQVNRVANVLKYIRGMGCRIIKPVDGDGKNWLIVIDGKTDVPFPSGIFAPWAHATSHLYGAGSSSTGALNFTSEQNSNSAIVEAAHAADTITIKRTAWYTVSIGARFRVSLGAAAYRGHSQVVVQLDTGAGPVDTVLLIEFCVQHLATAPIGSPTPLAFVTVSRQLDIQLSKDDVITATAPYNDNAEYAYCRLTVRRIHD